MKLLGWYESVCLTTLGLTGLTGVAAFAFLRFYSIHLNTIGEKQKKITGHLITLWAEIVLTFASLAIKKAELIF